MSKTVEATVEEKLLKKPANGLQSAVTKLTAGFTMAAGIVVTLGSAAITVRSILNGDAASLPYTLLNAAPSVILGTAITLIGDSGWKCATTADQVRHYNALLPQLQHAGLASAPTR